LLSIKCINEIYILKGVGKISACTYEALEDTESPLMQNTLAPPGQSGITGPGLLGLGNIVPTVQPVGYGISWAMLYHALGIPINLL
jgi:hypothetical protein